jgi:sulfite reductase alpha subunit-like flavoprotein
VLDKHALGTRVVPSRQVLNEAEEHYLRTGNEFEGFLSEQRGFLPRNPPELSLPASHRAWDEIAAALPSLWRDVGVRAAVRDLPPLRATEAELPATHIRRAATILGMLAHSYTYSELGSPSPLPPVLEQPWSDVASRLGRSEPYMQYEDLILGNWFQPDPAAPLTLDHLRLLVETLGIPTERLFYLAQVEIHARAAPIVGSVVRAQEALAAGDEEGAELELLLMIEIVRAVYDEIFLRVDPNAYSPTHVDPALWGALVAPFAVSFKEHVPGPGGTAAPLIHVLDAFLGRGGYESSFGHEAMRLRQWGPRAVGEFVLAVADGPGAHDVLTAGPRRLRGLVQTLADAYAGERGLLEAHRIKAYGFLETAFKVGRPVTIGGFGGTFHDRPWRTVHAELDASRRERDLGRPYHAVRGVLAERTPASTGSGVKHIVLDVSGEGVVYRPGDRCLILPTNPEDQVRRTMHALGVTGSEPIALTDVWRLAIRPRLDGDAPTELAVAEFLGYATLRPLLRSVAKTLHARSGSPGLHEVIEARQEDQWELWDILELMAEEGYDVTSLWRSREPADGLAGVVPPTRARQYAIASPGYGRGPADALDLTVETLEYESERHGRDPVLGRGTASSYLNETAPVGSAVPIEMVRPPRFRLPAADDVPIAMFAERTGISTFRSFLHQRAAAARPGKAWLFFATPSRNEIYFLDELLRFSADGWLTVRLALSDQEDRADLPFEAAGARLDEVVLVPENARMLWNLLGGEGGRAYICGRDKFVQDVLTALQDIASNLGSGNGVEFVRRLLAENRLMVHVFPTLTAAHAAGVPGGNLYDTSELVLHNDDACGYWLGMAGTVYDMTEFRHRHPGGSHIVDGSAGMDAYSEYSAVYHYRDFEINAMLEMYKIGGIRRLRFEDARLHDLFRAWIRLLYLIVEMQNAFENDVHYLEAQTTAVDPAETLTPLKLMMFANTHRRFVELYYKGLSEPLDELYRRTVELCDPTGEMGWLRTEIDGLSSAREDVFERIATTLRLLWQDARDEGFSSLRAADRVAAVSRCDRSFLVSMKDVIRGGVQLFEQHEHEALEHGDSILATLRSVPALLEAYLRDLSDLVESEPSSLH